MSAFRVLGLALTLHGCATSPPVESQTADRQRAIDLGIQKLRDLNRNSPDDCEALERAFHELTVEGAPLSDAATPEYREAESLVTTALVRRETERRIKESVDRIERLEKEVRSGSNLDAARREVSLVDAAAGHLGGDYPERVTVLKKSLYFQILKRIHADAIAGEAAAGNDLVAGLKAFDDSINKFSMEFDKGYPAALNRDTVELYIQLLRKSDALVSKLITPDYIAQVPARNLLSPGEEKTWKIMEGVTREFVGGEMRLKGVPGMDGNPIRGLVTAYGYDPAKPWHDYVIELEFKVNQYDRYGGGFHLHLRCNASNRPYVFDTDEAPFELPGKRPCVFEFDKATLKPGKSYHVIYIVRGSTVEVIDEGKTAQVFDLGVDTSRTGGFAFAINNGVDLVVTKCVVKVLRPRL